MLSELYEDGAVGLEGTQRALGATEVACFEGVSIAFVIVFFEGVAVAVCSLSVCAVPEKSDVLFDIDKQSPKHPPTPLDCRPCVFRLVAHRHRRP